MAWNAKLETLDPAPCLNLHYNAAGELDGLNKVVVCFAPVEPVHELEAAPLTCYTGGSMNTRIDIHTSADTRVHIAVARPSGSRIGHCHGPVFCVTPELRAAHHLDAFLVVFVGRSIDHTDLLPHA
jgi:hypothetical protein